MYSEIWRRKTNTNGRFPHIIYKERQRDNLCDSQFAYLYIHGGGCVCVCVGGGGGGGRGDEGG